MPDWSLLRRRARACQRRLRAHLPASAPLLPDAESLLIAAAEETGVDAYRLPPGDNLLGGAHAVLDRDLPGIWYADGPSESLQNSRFARAHEYAHFWLHPDLSTDTCQIEEPDDLFAGPGLTVTQTAEGYGPKERREIEANLFAAELLLPCPILRKLFIEQGWNASQIAARVGISESCVLSQLAEALLLPPSPHEEEDPPPPTYGHTFRLDESQQAAAYAPTGPLLVDAGPGTGKTRTLIARLVWLLQEQGVSPDNILALTFSNLAAEEMRSRLQEAVGPIADRVWIGTFHAFGYELLRKDGVRIGLPHDPALIDTAEAVSLLEQNLDLLPLQEFEYLSFPILPFPDILACISRAKDELASPADYLVHAHAELAGASEDEKRRRAARKSFEIAGIYEVYQQLLARRGLVDFGDLIMRSVELLDACPDLLSRWQQQFSHILADEYQDINRASAMLLQRLAGSSTGFWAVGDLRQAIYRFRGASPANVRDFDRDFPGGRRLRLGCNYRSTPEIVSLVGRFASGMGDPDSPEASWQAMRPGRNSPAFTLVAAEDEEAEADGLAALIRESAAAGVALRDQAILCRTNRQVSDLAARLEAHGVPTLALGSFFDREEIKDLLAVLELACKPDGSALARVARAACYDVPLDDVLCLLHAARKAGQPFPSALTLASDLPDLSREGRIGLQRLYADLKPFLFHGDAWRLLCRYLFGSGSYLRMLLADPSHAGAQRRRAIYQLLTLTQGLTRRLPPAEGENAQSALLKDLRHRLVCGQDRIASPTLSASELEGVRLMTVHQSKGLEFPVVYLPDLVEGQFPPRKGSRMAAPPPGLYGSADTDEGGEEEGNEECLFFVALSRARDQLVLISPTQWRRKPAKPSRLLQRIETALSDLNAQRLEWSRQPAPMLPSSPSSLFPLPSSLFPLPSSPYSVSSLEQYQRCPRQFYYSRVLQLPESQEDPVYLRFHIALNETMQWLQTERAADRDPMKAEIEETFRATWKERGPDFDTAQARILEQRGLDLLAQAHKSVAHSRRPRSKQVFTARLDHGEVRLTCDQVEELPDGSLQLVDYRTSRPGDDDHTEPRLALLRHAAQQQHGDRPIRIVLDYLRNGEQKEVKESKRWEPARVEKYNAALQAIRAGNFPPSPEPRKCALCPWFLVCPS